MMRKCFWRPEEDLILKQYVETYGEGNWATVSKESGLKRGGKSCRLRWKNYLRPNIKRGAMSEEEVDLIIRMHKLVGNRWSLIAGRLPGRTDNEVKNYWNTHLNKKCTLGKRSSSLDSNNYNHIKKDDRRSNNGKRSRKIRDVASPGTYNEELEGKKEEKKENAVADIVTWIQDSMGFNTYPESPIVPDHNVIFGLEGEPLGSFVFCETFEFSGEDVHLQETDLFSA